MDHWLTVIEVARVMGTHKQSVYRLIYEGELPYSDVSRGTQRRRIRIRASAVEAYMASRERTAA